MNTGDYLKIPLLKTILPLFEKTLVIPPRINYSMVVNNYFLTLLFLQQVLDVIPSLRKSVLAIFFSFPAFI